MSAHEAAGTTPAPLRVTFGFRSGAELSVSIANHPSAQDRVLRSLHPRDRDTFMTLAPPANASAATMKRHRELIRRTERLFTPGRDSVLLTASSARLTASKTFGIHDAMIDSLAGHMNVIYAPIRMNTAKKHCLALPQLAQLRPDHVVLGLGLEDFVIDHATGKTLVDPDEFEYRLDWFIGELVSRAQPRIIWCHNPPVTDGFNEARGVRYSPKAAAPFIDIAERACREYGVTTVTVEAQIREGEERKLASDAKKRLVDRLVALLVSSS